MKEKAKNKQESPTIIVRLKDVTSICWIAAQGIKIVGNKPVKVQNTPFVNKRVKAGVLHVVTIEQYDNFHSNLAKKTEDKLTVAIDVFDSFIDKKDVDGARKQLKKLEKLGVKSRKLQGFTGRLTYMKTLVDNDIIKKERAKIAGVLVDNCIQAEVFKVDKNEFLCLGTIKLGKEAEHIIDWASRSEENIETLKVALTDKEKDLIPDDHKQIVIDLVNQCVEAEVFTINNDGLLCFGDNIFGKKADSIVEWAVEKTENIDQLKQALLDKDASS